MQEMAVHLARVEDRLERLLAGGWRGARADGEALAAEAATLAEAGLPELAAALGAVVAAGEPLPWLRAITLALAHARLLRVRLAGDPVPPGAWQPVLPSFAAKAKERRDRLLPLSRIALEDREAWVCVRLRGSQPDQVLLLSPPTDLPRPDSTPWLRRALTGTLRWTARLPLGGSGEVQLCTLEQAEWGAPFESEEDDPVGAFRSALGSGKVRPAMAAFRWGGPITLEPLAPDDAAPCDWISPAAREAYFAAAGAKVWVLAWTERGLVAPLAIITPGGLLRRPAIAHLLPGNPTETLAV